VNSLLVQQISAEEGSQAAGDSVRKERVVAVVSEKGDGLGRVRFERKILAQI
jgi:hypothetical protein